MNLEPITQSEVSQKEKDKYFTFIHIYRIYKDDTNDSTPVFLPGESYGQRSLEGYSPWGLKESDTTKQLNMHACIYYSCVHIYNCWVIC